MLLESLDEDHQRQFASAVAALSGNSLAVCLRSVDCSSNVTGTGAKDHSYVPIRWLGPDGGTEDTEEMKS